MMLLWNIQYFAAKWFDAVFAQCVDCFFVFVFLSWMMCKRVDMCLTWIKVIISFSFVLHVFYIFTPTNINLVWFLWVIGVEVTKGGPFIQAEVKRTRTACTNQMFTLTQHRNECLIKCGLLIKFLNRPFFSGKIIIYNLGIKTNQGAQFELLIFIQCLIPDSLRKYTSSFDPISSNPPPWILE